METPDHKLFMATCGIADHVECIKTTTTYRYWPKNKKELSKIKQGCIPSDLMIYLMGLKQYNTSDFKWRQDSMTFTIETINS